MIELQLEHLDVDLQKSAEKWAKFFEQTIDKWLVEACFDNQPKKEVSNG